MHDPAPEPEQECIDSVAIVSPQGGSRWPVHRHDAHELLSAISRRIVVRTADGAWFVPRGASIWLPAGVDHAVEAAGANRMRCSWLSVPAPEHLREVRVLTVPDLLDNVLDHLGAQDLDDAARVRAEAFALDLLTVRADEQVALPLPHTAWLAPVADALLADPADGGGLEAWAARCAVSPSTLTRRFRTETGMGFLQWRTELRMRAARSLLLSGAPVREAARGVGFRSVPAFTTAFQRHAGAPPAEWARSMRSARSA